LGNDGHWVARESDMDVMACVPDCDSRSSRNKAQFFRRTPLQWSNAGQRRQEAHGGSCYICCSAAEHIGRHHGEAGHERLDRCLQGPTFRKSDISEGGNSNTSYGSLSLVDHICWHNANPCVHALLSRTGLASRRHVEDCSASEHHGLVRRHRQGVHRFGHQSEHAA